MTRAIDAGDRRLMANIPTDLHQFLPDLFDTDPPDFTICCTNLAVTMTGQTGDCGGHQYIPCKETLPHAASFFPTAAHWAAVSATYARYKGGPRAARQPSDTHF